jgi:hypothetical protein
MATKDQVPRLDTSPEDRGFTANFVVNEDTVTRILTQTASSYLVTRIAGVTRYDGAQARSSCPCEDRFIHGMCPSPWNEGQSWVTWGVFDGHSGLEECLLPTVRQSLLLQIKGNLVGGFLACHIAPLTTPSSSSTLEEPSTPEKPSKSKKTSIQTPGFDFGHFWKGVNWKFGKRRTTIGDESAGLHLIQKALGGNQKELIADRLAVGAPLSRNLRDDITVQVVFFDVPSLYGR